MSSAAAVPEAPAAAAAAAAAPIDIRRATADDAVALAQLKLETFRATFVAPPPAGFGVPYPPDDLAAFERSAYSVEKIQRELADAKTALFVAARDGRLVGYAKVSECHLPHPEVRPGEGELCQLYLREEVQGQGLGPRLMDTAMAYLTEHFPGRLWLGVWSGNERAQKFYSRYGFSKVGNYLFPVGAWNDHEFIFRRD